ncbi:MAG: antibiotic biosynthesis monooxygenase [Solirubrobacterales bacterium]|jgi:quinol monooxygenase YgiN|nr:antibiotic biosynthesis monooxygenase [Solirubrobacterales bacterium]
MSNVTVGLWVPMEAKPGKEDEVAEFLTGAKPIVDAEPDTTAWFAIRMGPTSFGIFDVFENDAGRQAHLSGKVAAALMEKAPDLFATPPGIRQYDVLASKLPG